MITKLNLATKPFRNRRTPYILAALVAFLSVISLLLLYSQFRENENRREIAERQVEEMKAEIAEQQAKGQAVQQQLSPMQRDLLVASHKLVANKTFGWSRLFYDLERLIPGSVSASRIAVENVYRDRDRIRAELEVTVISRDYQAVMAMIAAMNESGVFRSELRSQNLQAGQRSTFSEYTMAVTYLPPIAFSTPADVAQNEAQNQGGAE